MPGGYAGLPRCSCGEADIARYRRRLSGPLLDRLDLLVDVQRPTPADFAAGPVCHSAAERERVVAARERQAARLSDTGAMCNAHLDGALVRRTSRSILPLPPCCAGPMTVGRSARAATTACCGWHGTIADLDGVDTVGDTHLLEALGFRQDVADSTEEQVA